jgi:hypothetical protein
LSEISTVSVGSQPSCHSDGSVGRYAPHPRPVRSARTRTLSPCSSATVSGAARPSGLSAPVLSAPVLSAPGLARPGTAGAAYPVRHQSPGWPVPRQFDRCPLDRRHSPRHCSARHPRVCGLSVTRIRRGTDRPLRASLAATAVSPAAATNVSRTRAARPPPPRPPGTARPGPGTGGRRRRAHRIRGSRIRGSAALHQWSTPPRGEPQPIGYPAAGPIGEGSLGLLPE